MTPDERAAWEAGLRAVHAEAAGVFAVYIIRPSDIPRIRAGAANGSPLAEGLNRATSHTIVEVHRAPRQAPSLCLSCPATVPRGSVFAVVLMVPDSERPEQCMGGVLCSRCATLDDDALQERCVAAVREVFPDARTISIHPAEGHA